MKHNIQVQWHAYYAAFTGRCVYIKWTKQSHKRNLHFHVLHDGVVNWYTDFCSHCALQLATDIVFVFTVLSTCMKKNSYVVVDLYEFYFLGLGTLKLLL